MSRPRGYITSRSGGSYRLVYTLGADPLTGKHRTATCTIRGTRKEAERELTRRLRMVDANEHPADPSRMGVFEWLETWLETVRTEVTLKTHERYSEIVPCYLTPAFGRVPLAKLNPTQIQSIYTTWATGGRRDGKQGGLSPQTRIHIHRVFKLALSRAVEQQVLARNPADLFKGRLPKVERKEMATLTAEQSTRLLFDQTYASLLAHVNCPLKWPSSR